MNKNSKAKIVSILLTVILLIVIFSISALIAIQSVKIKQKTSTSQPNPSLTPAPTVKLFAHSEKVCLENNGKWIEAFTECEGIKEEVCTRYGGSYEPCTSACRHQPESQVCIQICVEICDFKGAQQGGP